MDLLLKLQRDGVEESVTLVTYDYGGQRVFYAMHHLFLTRFGVYLACFDMRKLVDVGAMSTVWKDGSKTNEKETVYDPEGCLSFLRFWLASIYEHARDSQGGCATVMLIGTHGDLVTSPAQHKAVSDRLLGVFGVENAANGNGMLMISLEYFSDELCFWPLDNTQRPASANHRKLRERINEVVMREEFVQRPLPLAWLRFSDELAAIAAGTATVDGDADGEKQPVLSLAEVRVVAERCGVKSEHLLQVLRLLHQLGSIVFYDEPGLRDLVVLEPQWLVVAVARVIRDYDLHTVQRDRQARALGKQWLMLTKEAKLTKGLLELLWVDYTPLQRRVLLALLLKFGLCCPLPNDKDLSAPVYLVPSILPEVPYPNIERFASCATLHTRLSDRLPFLPAALWARLLVRCTQFDVMLQQSSEAGSGGSMVTGPTLSRHWALLSFGGKPFLLHNNDKDQVVSVEIGSDFPTPLAETLLELARDTCSEWLPELSANMTVETHGASFDIKAVLALENSIDGSLTHPTQPGLFLGRAELFPWLRPLGDTSYDLFISYRQASEGQLAQLLFHDLTNRTIGQEQRQVRVFLDRNRLLPSQPWNAGCLRQLTSSAVVCPLVSYGALQRMELLDPERGTDFRDNVLLEWMLTLELHAQGRLKAIQPILIGKIKEDGSMGNFFNDGSMGSLKDMPSPKALAALRAIAADIQPPLMLSAQAEMRTIKGTLDALLAFPTTPWWEVRSASGTSPFHREAASMVFGQVRFVAKQASSSAQPVATAVVVGDAFLLSAFPTAMAATLAMPVDHLYGGLQPPAALTSQGTIQGITMTAVIDEAVAVGMVLPNVPAQLGFVAHGVLGALATELGVEAPVPLGLPTVEGLAELLARTHLEAAMPQAQEWCEQQGVFSVEMLLDVNMEGDFVAALGLRPAQAKYLELKLEKMKKAEDETPALMAQPAMQPAAEVAQPPTAGDGGCCIVS